VELGKEKDKKMKRLTCTLPIHVQGMDRPHTEIMPTDHPLVALYCLRCDAPNIVTVKFRETTAPGWVHTKPKECKGDSETITQYIAGMRPSTKYDISYHLTDPNDPSAPPVEGPVDSLRTAELPKFPPFTPEQVAQIRKTWNDEISVLDPYADVKSQNTRAMKNLEMVSDTFLWIKTVFAQNQIMIGEQGYWPSDLFFLWIPRSLVMPSFPVIFATDAGGTIMWYAFRNETEYFNYFPNHDGLETFLVFDQHPGNWKVSEKNLLGHNQRSIDIQTLNKKLKEMGKDFELAFFREDSRKLDNGNYLLIAATEKVVTDVDDDHETEIDYLADVVLEFDFSTFEIKWVWNMFDHIDAETMKAYRPKRDKTCKPFCKELKHNTKERKFVNWAHTNSISYDPNDGNILISLFNQDRVYKLDYRDGAGNGDILWVLGDRKYFKFMDSVTGKFLGSSERFGGQSQIIMYDDNELVLFDNGNARNEPPPPQGGYLLSGMQSIKIDEETMEATVLKFNPAYYSPEMGSAQKLSNGNYFIAMTTALTHFWKDLDTPIFSSTFVFEVAKDGQLLYSYGLPGIQCYQVIRMPSLYDVAPVASS